MDDPAIDSELRAAVRGMRPPEGAEERVAKRLAASLAAPRATRFMRATVASVIVLAGVSALVTWRARMPVPAPIAPPHVDGPAILPSLSVVPTPQIAPVVRPHVRTAPPVREEHKTVVAKGPREDSLTAEQALLGHAREAFERADVTAAAAQLMAYDARFPHGELAEERDALWIYVLAREGRAQEARSRLDMFAHAHPQSPLRERLRGAVEEGEQQ
jgi:hypothetical protein